MDKINTSNTIIAGMQSPGTGYFDRQFALKEVNKRSGLVQM
jgi:hypothetical protein